ncbi:alpha-L-fucosidase [Mariniflexile gromovii]|uniref:alpha-L-fucosidase n=1 Tax=Mariniflexile gromovii TaxID=362523 RepID=A0ABS4BXV2_9FLAO|nr:alpha-L-fucosidase [Mariniflexile gromovii]MBP0905419.1 alpha-L-fucosidase [Mariniflexile gromovii]
MSNKIVLQSLIIMVFLGFYNCKQKETLKVEKTQTFDQTRNWVILNKADAVKDGNTYTWHVEIKHPVDYLVQVVFDALPTNLALVKVKIDDQELVGDFQQDYTTYNDKIVSEFDKSIKISDASKQHVITIQTEANFDQLRLVPSYKTPVGTGVHHQEWLKMHESPEKQAALAWFKEAKFGMFIHWGLYSQAGGIWKETKINNAPFPGPKVAEWLMHAFQIPREEYAELAKTFNPDKSFAQNIAKLAKQSGMKYVVITSKHHDGFALFDSKCSTYDMVDATPYKADAVKELYEACLSEGLDFGVYYSHGNDWNDGGDGNYANVKKINDSLGIYTHSSGKNLWDPSPNTHTAYYESKSYPQIQELIALLPKLRLIWFDGEGFTTEDQSFKFYKMVYNTNPNILVNRRVGWDFGDYLDAGDNKIPSANDKLDKYWETCGTTNNSWGYKEYDQDWKSTKELLYYFVDIMSKGGNYLLNIGPDGKGHVPEASSKSLLEMGEWIAVNGDAVYGTSRWIIANEGEEETLLEGTGHRAAKGFKRNFTTNDFWFTTKANAVYAISLAPSSHTVLIRSLNKSAGDIQEVSILNGHPIQNWSQTEEGLLIQLKTAITAKNGFVVKATIK